MALLRWSNCRLSNILSPIFSSPPTSHRVLIKKGLTAYKFSLRQCVAAGKAVNSEIREILKKAMALLSKMVMDRPSLLSY